MDDKESVPQSLHPELSRRLRADSELIIRKWEAEVRKKVSSARGMEQLALRDSLPEFLHRLADTLSAVDKARTIKEAGDAGKKHGIERAYQSNYNVSEVLLEYWLLRTVIFETIEDKSPISISARNLVLAAVDEGIRKAVEEFAEARTRALEQSNRDLEHFAAIAAHDLKSPLATIAGYLELLSEGAESKFDDDHVTYIKTSKRLTANMSIMLDRLLDYSSVGHQHAPFEAVAMNDVAHQAQSHLLSAIDKTNASITVEPLPTVNGDPSLLCLVFQNLLSNAIKFRDARPPKITVRAEQFPEAWVFSVIDNGVGFDSKHAESIFSLFKQAHQRQNYQGFGIGLATAKKVIELHGGTIWAQSVPGKGSTFFFSLPRLA